MLADIHCHLTHEKLANELDQIIQRARNAGVKRIITAGTNKETNRKIIWIKERYPDIIRCSLGMYPLEATGINDNGEKTKAENWEEEIEFIINNKDKIIAVGEIGLDYSFGKNEEQTTIFRRFLDLAEKINKPVIVHSRKAEKDCIELLKTRKIPIILHCFHGRKSIVKEAAKTGMHFSIPPILLRSSQFEMIVKEVNINQLLTETDSPWLNNIQGETNEPANVARTIAKIAQIKGMDPIEVENNTYMNYQKIFKD